MGEPCDSSLPSSPTDRGEELAERVEALGHLATDALLLEARLTPKPGLVDAANTGAHDDMDLGTFEVSAMTLRPWLVRCAQAGAEGADPATLVEVGIAAEQAMYAATDGVNTHKGALYSLGLACAAAGSLRAAERPTSVVEVCEAVASLAARTSPPPSGVPRTHGEQALATLGLTGARGEAWAGFPRARRHGVPALRGYGARGWSRDDALRATLVHLMAATADTNLVARGGETALRATWAWARALVAAERRGEPLRGPAFLAELERMDRVMTRHRWSPGGSADLLSLSWFLWRLEEDSGHESGPRG